MRRSLILVSLLTAGNAMATNGMNLIGYGAGSALTAGGRMANANPSAMVGNPALLGDITAPMLCGSLTLLMPGMSYTDHVPAGMGMPNEGAVMNDAVDSEPATFPLPFIGYARPQGDKLVWGVCGYAQGGMGVDFQDLNTVFGTQDDIYSNVAYMRLTGGLAYKANENSRVGLSLSVGYAMLEFDYFPNTMVDMNGDMIPEFNGMKVTDLSSFGYNAKLGVSQRMLDGRLNLGAWFGTEAAVEFDDGTLAFASGQEFDVKFKDFSWPSELGLGFAWQATDRVMVLGDLVQYGWESAVDEPALETGTAIDAMLPAFQMHWENQTAVSLATMVKMNEKLTLMGGVNHGASPVPDQALNALFPAIVETHVTLGAKYKVGEWSVLGGLELVPEASQTNSRADDATDYFGMTNTTIDHSQLSLHLGFSRTF